MPVKITKLQAEILNHRLDAPDCIKDALDLKDYNRVCDLCDELQKNVNDLKLPDSLDGVLADILEDCIDGSTYLADSYLYESPQKCAAMIRSYEQLAEKIAKIIGREVKTVSFRT